MRPLLSIVIANYNYGRFIETAIRSVLSQADDRMELIVIDGGSSDQSVPIIKKYADRIAYWVSEKDRGQSNAFNKGFSRATGKYLTWLNADDIFVAGCLKQVLSEMERHPDCEWFTANMLRFDMEGRVTAVDWGPHIYPQWMQRADSPLVAFGPSTFFSKKIYDQVGGINESLHYIMDTDLWLRFMKMGVKLRRVNCLCWGFRMHEASKTAEFGEHKLDDVNTKKLKAEEEKVFSALDYKMSRWLHLLVRILRLTDGSFIRGMWIRKTFRHISSAADVKLLQPSQNELFPYQEWFAEAWQMSGGAIKVDLKVPRKIRGMFGRLGMSFSTGIKTGRLLVCGGGMVDSVAWPWCYFYEIIPVMWDLWPDEFKTFVRFVKRNRVRTVFCTSSQQVARLEELFPSLRVKWIPEGIKIAEYPKGGGLCERQIDILNYGRKVHWLNDLIMGYGKWCRPIKHVFTNTANNLVFPSVEELRKGIRDSKIVISYPQCDTNPKRTGGIETLTQRYWECMLSGTLMIGRAPKELVDLCGYNPVIELGENPCEKINEILQNIEEYQGLADRNRECAERVAGWDKRMSLVKETLYGEQK